MKLYRTELRRILRRRLALVFGILIAAGTLLLAGIVWFASSSGPTEAEIETARPEIAAEHPEYAECLRNEEFFEQEWGWDENDPMLQDQTHEELCDEFIAPWEAQEQLGNNVYTFDFEAEGVWFLVGLSIVVGLVTMFLAASSIGAEWNSGSMANLLLWHPNRLKVWGVKLGAAVTVTAAVIVAVVVLEFLLLYPAAAVRGEVGTLDADWWSDTLGILVRTLVLVAGMAVFGASLAMLGRHTAIAGGLIAGYLIVGELIVWYLTTAANISYPDRFSLYTWVGAWITGKTELYDLSGQAAETETMIITSTDSALLLGGIIAVFAALATWAFAKRDT
ncbi:ABC transporter permease subunit [Glycomyces salinus]|uniref:ABC transporter permease subunit n=1 Tax=Glycomyces salinus TaxID=980294 RepID=UPI0018EA7FA6|nr:ABC transporter permease subunit [Glycomyces salinus]